MIGTRASSLFGLLPLLAIGCAPGPDPVEQSQSALLDDDVVNYVPLDRSLEILPDEALPDVMGAPSDILAIAVAEEGKTLEQVGVSTGFPLSTYAGEAPGGWCSEFVAWSYWRGGCPFTGQRGTYPWMIGGSTQIRQWFVTNSRFVYQTNAEWESYEPQPGDYIRYNNPEGGHSGIVRYAEGTTLYTVEGNVNSKVMLRTLRNYKTAYADPEDGIDGFGVMTDAQCGSTNGEGGAAGTGGSAGAGGGAGIVGAGGAAGDSTGTGGAAGAAGSGGGAGASGAAGSTNAGGEGGGGGVVSTAGTGGSAGRRGRGGASGAGAGTGGRSATAGRSGTAGATASTMSSGGAAGTAGSAGAGGVASAGGAGARGGAGGDAGRSGSTSSASSAGGSSGGVGSGGTFSKTSATTGAGGSDQASAQASSNGCSCSLGRGSDARHGLWLTALAAFGVAGRRKRR